MGMRDGGGGVWRVEVRWKGGGGGELLEGYSDAEKYYISQIRAIH